MGGLAAVAGCSSPGPEARFDSSDPRERVLAAVEAVERGDRDAVPELIAMLGSEDAVARMLAIEGLERLVGERRGYDWAAEREERVVAASRWVAWWESGG